MPTISPKEYAANKHYKSVSTVYKQMREGKLPWVVETMEVKRIPVDENGEPVKSI